MKKILLMFILTGSLSFTFAQTIKLTITAGVNESTASNIPDNYIKQIAEFNQTFPNSKLPGFHVGVFTERTFGQISIQPGLLYTTKGGIPYSYSANNTESGYYYRKDVLRLNYIELPLNILYNMPIGSNKFFIGGGPYIGFGISGKQSYAVTTNSFGAPGANHVNKGNEKVTFGSGYDDIKGTDLGLGAKFGLVIKQRWTISLNYEYGLTNLSNDPSYSGKNKSLNLSLGYTL